MANAEKAPVNKILHSDSAAVILVDSREAARRLAISPRKLWQLTKDRAVPSVKIGKCVRYRVVDLESWTQRQVELGV
jgi:predicted DNA-binding transcriptional regulator AlpA